MGEKKELGPGEGAVFVLFEKNKGCNRGKESALGKKVNIRKKPFYYVVTEK